MLSSHNRVEKGKQWSRTWEVLAGCQNEYSASWSEERRPSS